MKKQPLGARDHWIRTWGFALSVGALIAVFLASALAIFAGVTSEQSQQQAVTDTQATLLTVGDLRGTIGEAEAAVDDYVYSNGATGSQPYQDARAHASGDLRSLVAAPGLGANTSGDLAQLQQLTPATLADLQSAMLQVQAGQTTQAAQRLSAGDAARSLHSLRDVIQRIQVVGHTTLSAQIQRLEDARGLLLWVSALSALLDIVVLVAILIILRHTIALRERFAQERAHNDAQAHIKALEETTRRMKDFLELASHEIRTPLTSLKIALQLTARAVQRITADVRETPGEVSAPVDTALTRLSTVRAPLDRALVSTEQLERLVGDLVDSTRLEASALKLRPTACDLGALAEDCVAEQRLYHPHRVINCVMPEEAAIVLADGDRIRQVIANYLNNAHKFSEEAQPIEVRLSVDARKATISVRDKGPGIPAEEQTRIWDQFYRAPGIGHVSGSSEGFGLGLYICSSIIQQHGGAVGVESAIGQGSTFWFTLPLASVVTERAADSDSHDADTPSAE